MRKWKNDDKKLFYGFHVYLVIKRDYQIFWPNLQVIIQCIHYDFQRWKIDIYFLVSCRDNTIT